MMLRLGTTSIGTSPAFEGAMATGVNTIPAHDIDSLEKGILALRSGQTH